MHINPTEVARDVSAALLTIDSCSVEEILKEYEDLRGRWKSSFLAECDATQMHDLLLANLRKYASWPEFRGFDIASSKNYLQINTLLRDRASNAEYVIAVRVWKTGPMMYACGSSDFTKEGLNQITPKPEAADAPTNKQWLWGWLILAVIIVIWLPLFRLAVGWKILLTIVTMLGSGVLLSLDELANMFKSAKRASDGTPKEQNKASSNVMCFHCCKLFDYTIAQRHHTDIGDWIICPHCRKEAQDNIHPHCPYWSDWRCRHDPKHVTYCSLPTKAPYETCALL